VKESLNTDGQQFHQYQQSNHLSSQFIEHKKRPTHKCWYVMCKILSVHNFLNGDIGKLLTLIVDR
jgi:hypothetical protein